jgi:lysophospholipase L1-like esterase
MKQDLENANPILITPVARRSFDSTGKLRDSHPVYSGLVREVAKQANVPLIDLDEMSKSLLQKLGPETSKYLFNYLDPNEHPNYPEGRKDDTHFSELGARLMAELGFERNQKSSPGTSRTDSCKEIILGFHGNR